MSHPAEAHVASFVEDVPDHGEGVYQHAKRPEWGLAILAWEKGDKRAYQFNDGAIRILKAGFYGLMHEADVPAGQADELLKELNRRLKEAPATRSSKSAPRPLKPLKPLYPFSSQLQVFRAQYPDGFDDKKWVRGVRGDGASKRLKRHRHPAIAEAQELLAHDRLDDMIAKGLWDEVMADTTRVLENTDLARLNVIDSLSSSSSGHVQTFVEALRSVLYGKEMYSSRFGTWLSALQNVTDGRPSWQLATAIPALVFPNEQVCVRLSSFMHQAGEMAPTLTYSRQAGHQTYDSFHQVAAETQRRLLLDGLKPRDFLDVHDFIRLTLRPSAAKHLEASTS